MNRPVTRRNVLIGAGGLAAAAALSPLATGVAHAAAADGLAGWATQNGGTTGGAGGSTVTVSTAAALAEALAQAGALIVRISGTITLADQTRVASDKTVTGGTITGQGLHVRGTRNVIIQDVRFDNWSDDAVSIDKSATNVWVDHCTFGTGYDASLDVKHGSDYVTISWNRFNGQDKNTLVGHSDSNASEDRGKLRVTYHHNWFNGTRQRNPRVRFGNPVHVYNNLYQNNSLYGIASTEGAGVLVENNVFENVPDPFHLGQDASGPGTLVARGNLLTNSGAGQTGGTVASIPYSYSLDAAANVKSAVTAGAGAR